MAYSGGYKRDRPDDNGYDFPPQKRYAGFAEGRDASPPPPRGDYNNGGGSFGGSSTSTPRTHMREEKPSNVLLFTVFNPKYPITVDVMQTICSANNCVVNRIVIFRKNGVQAMVEFDTIESAERAKESLNGADIYSGCCTLKVDWGKPTKLTVTKNDSDSWDYTIPPPDKEPKSVPLLPDPKFPGHPERGAPGYGYSDRGPTRLWPPARDYEYDRDYRSEGPGSMGRYRSEGPGSMGPPDHRYDPYRRDSPGRYPFQPGHYAEPQDAFNDPYGPPTRGGGDYYDRPVARMGPPPPRAGVPGREYEYEMGAGYGAGAPPGGGMQNQGCVLMVYGCATDGQVNCQKLFNLFCIYGNVVRVKFLKSKEGVAMIQMGDRESCDRAMQNINGSTLYGSKLMVSLSKQAFIQDVPRPVTLTDGSLSFVDYMGTRNNRFTTPEAAARNRIHAVSKTLYFFNAPMGWGDEDILKLFVDADVKPPIKTKIFPTKSEKCCTGILEWENKADCLEALVAVNHTIADNPNGKNPFIVKFSFASPHAPGERKNRSE